MVWIDAILKQGFKWVTLSAEIITKQHIFSVSSALKGNTQIKEHQDNSELCLAAR